MIEIDQCRRRSSPRTKPICRRPRGRPRCPVRRPSRIPRCPRPRRQSRLRPTQQASQSRRRLRPRLRWRCRLPCPNHCRTRPRRRSSLISCSSRCRCPRLPARPRPANSIEKHRRRPLGTSSDVMSEIEEELFAVLPMRSGSAGLVSAVARRRAACVRASGSNPAIHGPGCAAGDGRGHPGADGAPQATTPIGTTTAVPARTAAKPMPRPAPNDPLAALKAMSDEERIALFT